MRHLLMMYKTSHMHAYSGIIWQQHCPCVFLSCPLGVALSFLGARCHFFLLANVGLVCSWL